MRKLAIILLLLLIPATGPAEPPAGRKPTAAELRHKALLLNAAVAGGIVTWGVVNWDYFQATPSIEREGWFDKETKSGGADKLGHAYSTYVAGRAFRAVYLDWGYDAQRAGRLGILSALGMVTLMEIGDSFSPTFSFSYEDVVMNLGGAGFGYLMEVYPDLDRKLDFRVEYLPEFGSDFSFDLITDYEHLKYLLVLRGDGFDALAESWLRYLELHAGYFSRNFEDVAPGLPDHRERTLYLGVGLNVGRLLARWVKWPIFDYLQAPYTYLPLEKRLD